MKKWFGFVSCAIILGLCLSATFIWGANNGEADDSAGTPTISSPTSNTHWHEDTSFFTSSFAGDGTKSNPYLISSPQELAGLAYNVNQGETYSDTYFKLSSNIDMSAHYWVPIASSNLSDVDMSNPSKLTDISKSLSIKFQGNFDGAGFVISGLYTIVPDGSSNHTDCPNYPEIAFGGLFGYVQYAAISNVDIRSSQIAYGSFAGSVAGFATESVFRNCRSEAVVSSIFSGGIIGVCDENFVRVYDCAYVGNIDGAFGASGGIIALASGDLEVKNCQNKGRVFNSNSVGGIIGYAGNYKYYLDKNTSSVVSTKVKIHNCQNYGEVQVVNILIDERYLGGIAGRCYGEIYSCQNYGVIKYESLGSSEFITSAGMGEFGGIAGECSLIKSSSNLGTFDIQINSEASNVKETVTVGGIVSNGVYLRGDSGILGAEAVIYDCFNKASITGGREVGGIVGFNNGTKVYNSYNLGDLESKPNGTAQGVGGKEVYNSFNVGKVTSTGTAKAVSIDSSTKCYYENLGTTDNNASAYGNLISVAKNISFYTTAYNWSEVSPWNFDVVWKISDSENDGYPVPVYNPEPDSDEPLMKGDWKDVYSTDFEGEGNEQSPYLIKTPEQLAGLAHFVNTNQNVLDMGNAIFNTDLYFALDNDIDMSGRYWSSIGYLNAENGTMMGMFSGTFDGRGYTISGLKMHKNVLFNEMKVEGGLFGFTYGATIKNLTLKNSEVFGGGIVMIGALSQQVETVYSNCHNYANVSAGDNQSMFGYAGGICSYIIQLNDGVGFKGASITNCSNHGNITCKAGNGNGDDMAFASGIVGYYEELNANNSQTVQIDKCYNKGLINGEAGASGITLSENLPVLNSYNKGRVEGYIAVGINFASGILNCFNMGEIVGVEASVGVGGAAVVNSFNVGNLSGNQVFAITANGEDAFVEKCYYTGNYEAGNSKAIKLDNLSTVAKTKVWFEDKTNWYEEGEDVKSWDFSNGWSIRKTINEGYPNLVMNSGWWTSQGNFTVAFEGNGTKDNPYLIATEQQLAGLSVMVNDGVSYSGKYFSQTADLDMSGLYWLSIGDNEFDYSFQGNYDGRGYTITGISTYEYACTGIFGRAINATFSNVVVGENSKHFMGAIVGEAENCTFLNCSNYATVARNDLLEGYHTGGIVGKLTGKDSLVDGCQNFGSMTGTYVGGIVGYIENNEETIRIQNCRNEGEIFGIEKNIENFKSNFVGGIVGFATTTEKATRGTKLIVDNCQNNGTISRAIEKHDYKTNGFGGIVGGIEISGEITNCENYGNFKYSSGGILGYINDNNSTSEISNTYGVSVKIDKCKNYGDIGSNVSSGYIGGIFQGNGNKVDLQILSSSNSGNILSNDRYIGGIIGGYSYGKRSLSTIKIMFSWNEGNISAEADAAGITSAEDDIVFSCYNIGTISSKNYSCFGVGGTARYSYNAGKLTKTGSVYDFYGVSRFASYCFNIGEMTEKGNYSTLLVGDGLNNYYGGASLGVEEYKSDEESVKVENIETLARTREWYENEQYWGSSSKGIFENFWQINSSVNNGLPTLKENLNLDDYFWATEKISDRNFEGNGNEQSPYLIETAEQLAGIVYLLKTNQLQEGLYFKQTANIDLSGKYWEAFGAVNHLEMMPYIYFSGNYDGANFKISGLENLGTDYVGGLFGVTNNSKISNLNLFDCKFQGIMYSGAFVGFSLGDFIIENCNSNSSVDSEGGSGGIIGVAMGNTTLKNCVFKGEVRSRSSYTGVSGGLICANMGTLLVDGCYSVGEIYATGMIGGFVGSIMDESRMSLIQNSISASKIFTCGNPTGGFVGQMQGVTIRNCLSAVNFVLYDSQVEKTKIAGFVGDLIKSGSSISNVIFNCSNVSTSSLTISPFACGELNSVVDLNSCYSVTNEGGFYTQGLFEGWVIDEKINNNLPVQVVLFHNVSSEATNVVEHLINKNFNLVA